MKLRLITTIFLSLVFLYSNICYAANNHAIVLIEPSSTGDNQTYSDEAISIHFSLYKDIGLTFELTNKIGQAIKIDWNNVVIVDPGKNTHNVIHTGIVYKDKNIPQAPSTIPPISMTKFTDTIFPTDNIYLENSFLSIKWRHKPFFSASDTGKTISLFLPLEINGTAKNYTFIYKLANQ